MQIKFIITRLGLSLILFGLASFILLVSDLGNRKGKGGKQKVICLVQYSESTISDETKIGCLEGFKTAGLILGKDFEWKYYNAQGDIPTLNTIMDAVNNNEDDILIVSSTPTLQAAIKKVKNIPIVFTTIADPIVAGAGKSFTDHLPNVTGVATLGDYEGLIKQLVIMMPGIKKIGTLFSPGEANSVHNKEFLNVVANKYGLSLVAVPVNSPSDVMDAATSLCSKKIEAITQIVDNMIDGSFVSISKVARKSKMPLFGYVTAQATKGAIAVVARDYQQSGKEAAILAARILRGGNPKDIPIKPVEKSLFVINAEAARYYGIAISKELISTADRVIEVNDGR